MEGASVFEIMAWKVQPEYQERFGNWLSEAYYPLGIKCGRKAIERYHILNENTDYNATISIMYYDDFEALVDFVNNPEIIYSNNDLNMTYGPRREVLWGAGYEVLKSFKKTTEGQLANLEPVNEKSPVIHLEGFKLAPADLGKFHSWFARWGYQFFIPSLMKLTGLIEYTHCRIIDYDQPEIMRATDFSVHPAYLSVLRFEDVESFENYEKSTELAAFREAMKVPFPGGLPFQWYVQYQLMRRWGN